MDKDEKEEGKNMMLMDAVMLYLLAIVLVGGAIVIFKIFVIDKD